MIVHFVLRPMRRFKVSGDIGCVAEPGTASATKMPSFTLFGGRPGEGGGVNMKEGSPRKSGRTGKECEEKRTWGKEVSLFVPSSGTVSIHGDQTYHTHRLVLSETSSNSANVQNRGRWKSQSVCQTWRAAHTRKPPLFWSQPPLRVRHENKLLVPQSDSVGPSSE